MLRFTISSRHSFWDASLFEAFTPTKLWKNVSGKGGVAYKEVPRNFQDCITATHPKTEERLRWYPFQRELWVGEKRVPMLCDILYTHYMPKHMLDDNERIMYAATKQNRDPEEVALELWKMRKLRLTMAQILRIKLKGHWLRQPAGSWRDMERFFLINIGKAIGELAMNMYYTDSFDPVIMYSHKYHFGDVLDAVLLRALREHRHYIMTEVVVHNSIPRSRLPGVLESCKFPLEKLEPCLFEELKLKVAVMALIAKEEGYVIDHAEDPGHDYAGMLVHCFQSFDSERVSMNIEKIELDTDLAKKFLRHYLETYVN